MKVFEDKLKRIERLCIENKVRSLFAFGSAVRDELKPESDIDLLVDLEAQDPIEYTDNYFNLLEQLQKVLGRPIDLLETRGLKNRYLKAEIDRTKIPLYE
jgi:predicted nucleotidyltransferase